MNKRRRLKKIKVHELNEIDKCAVENIIKIKSCFFEKNNKTEKPLPRKKVTNNMSN